MPWLWNALIWSRSSGWTLGPRAGGPASLAVARLESEAIVIAIIRLARSLGPGTVAEGVETEKQRDYLSRAGCEMAQGFWYSKPLPADEFARWLGEYHMKNHEKK